LASGCSWVMTKFLFSPNPNPAERPWFRFALST
jgi:hypothetical protein